MSNRTIQTYFIGFGCGNLLWAVHSGRTIDVLTAYRRFLAAIAFATLRPKGE